MALVSALLGMALVPILTFGQPAAADAPPTFTGDPAVSRRLDGRLELFGSATDGRVWYNVQDVAGGRWLGWHSLGGSADSGPAVVRTLDDRAIVMVRTAYNYLSVVEQDALGGFGSWQNAGGAGTDGGLRGTPAPILNTDGRVEVFSRSWQNTVIHTFQINATPLILAEWASFGSAGGGFGAAPAVASNADGRLEVFATAGGNLYHTYWTGAWWSGWFSLGGAGSDGGAVSVPAVQPRSNADGRLEVFARSGNGRLLEIFQGDTGQPWSAWNVYGGNVPGGSLASPPNAILNVDGRPEVFALTASTAAHTYATTTGGWAPWSNLPGAIPTSRVVPALYADGRVTIFVVDGGFILETVQAAPTGGALAWGEWQIVAGTGLLMNEPDGVNNTGDAPLTDGASVIDLNVDPVAVAAKLADEAELEARIPYYLAYYLNSTTEANAGAPPGTCVPDLSIGGTSGGSADCPPLMKPVNPDRATGSVDLYLHRQETTYTCAPAAARTILHQMMGTDFGEAALRNHMRTTTAGTQYPYLKRTLNAYQSKDTFIGEPDGSMNPNRVMATTINAVRSHNHGTIPNVDQSRLRYWGRSVSGKHYLTTYGYSLRNGGLIYLGDVAPGNAYGARAVPLDQTTRAVIDNKGLIVR